MLVSSVSAKVSTLVESMPNSSAWIVASTIQSTDLGPLRVAVEHGRAERLLGEGLLEDHQCLGPASGPSGQADRTPASWDLSEVQPSH